MFNCLGKCFKSKQKVVPESNEIKKKERKVIKEKEVDISSTFMYLKDNMKISNIMQNIDFDKYSHKDFNIVQSNDPKVNDNSNLPEDSLFKKNAEVIKNIPLVEYKGKFRCLFCGGSSCKSENWLNHKDPAIKGLHSDYIASNLFASQRPSNRLIIEFNIIKQFKDLEIGLVINLQREGEHPYCGDKIIENKGFSYDPKRFFKEGIKYRNFGWKDLSNNESMTFIHNVVKEIGLFIKKEKKKVFIHCHSGNRRTGIIIACYLLWENELSVEEVVMKINQKRPGCLNKEGYIDYCKRFKEYLKSLKIVFTPKPMSIDFFLKNQSEIIFDYEVTQYQNIPKILSKVLETTINIKNDGNMDNLLFYKKFYFLHSWSHSKEQKVSDIKQQINTGNWSVFFEERELDYFIQILIDWLEDCVDYLILPSKITSLLSKKIDPNMLSKHISSYGEMDLNKKKAIYSQFKSHFTVSELEILLELTSFFKELIPQNVEEFFFYERMLERLSLIICGINLEKINYKFQNDRMKFSNNYLPFELKFLIEGFKLIIDYLTVVMKTELPKEKLISKLEYTPPSVYSSTNSKQRILNHLKTDVIKSDHDSKKFNTQFTNNSKYLQVGNCNNILNPTKKQNSYNYRQIDNSNNQLSSLIKLKSLASRLDTQRSRIGAEDSILENFDNPSVNSNLNTYVGKMDVIKYDKKNSNQFIESFKNYLEQQKSLPMNNNINSNGSAQNSKNNLNQGLNLSRNEEIKTRNSRLLLPSETIIEVSENNIKSKNTLSHTKTLKPDSKYTYYNLFSKPSDGSVNSSICYSVNVANAKIAKNQDNTINDDTINDYNYQIKNGIDDSQDYNYFHNGLILDRDSVSYDIGKRYAFEDLPFIKTIRTNNNLTTYNGLLDLSNSEIKQ